MSINTRKKFRLSPNNSKSSATNRRSKKKKETSPTTILMMIETAWSSRRNNSSSRMPYQIITRTKIRNSKNISKTTTRRTSSIPRSDSHTKSISRLRRWRALSKSKSKPHLWAVSPRKLEVCGAPFKKWETWKRAAKGYFQPRKTTSNRSLNRNLLHNRKRPKSSTSLWNNHNNPL